MSAKKSAIAFVDRDGTIIAEPKDKQIDSLEKLAFLPGIITGLRLLIDSGYELVMVTNQDGLGTKKYPRESYDQVQEKLMGVLKGEGITFSKVLLCPHLPSQNCACRKPKLGLMKGFKAFDAARSAMLGDRETDVEFGRALGIRTVRLNRGKTQADFATDSALEACRWIAQSGRSVRIERRTTETQIQAELQLQGQGHYEIETGIPFFNHMLEQLAKHSLMDIKLKAKGDLEIDPHHTVEDVGIVIGSALKEALGDKRGITRYGFTIPMDEARADVAIDLSGRGFLKFDAEFKRPEIGGLPTELVEDFFIAFAGALGSTLHIRCSGRNDHHKIESIFKSVARALRMATQIDARSRGAIPSTKGSL